VAMTVALLARSARVAMLRRRAPPWTPTVSAGLRHPTRGAMP
jgi:hypothetical protein